MAITLFFAGIPVVGIIAIAYAITDCYKMSKGERPIEKMNEVTEGFMTRYIVKLVRVETVTLIFVIVSTILLWRSMATADPDMFTFVCGVVYLIMWIDLVMMAFTFSLTYQVHLSKKQ